MRCVQVGIYGDSDIQPDKLLEGPRKFREYIRDVFEVLQGAQDFWEVDGIINQGAKGAGLGGARVGVYGDDDITPPRDRSTRKKTGECGVYIKKILRYVRIRNSV